MYPRISWVCSLLMRLLCDAIPRERQYRVEEVRLKFGNSGSQRSDDAQNSALSSHRVVRHCKGNEIALMRDEGDEAMGSELSVIGCRPISDMSSALMKNILLEYSKGEGKRHPQTCRRVKS